MPVTTRFLFDPRTLLRSLPAPVPRHRWRGTFTGLAGAAAGQEFEVSIGMEMRGVFIEGEGRVLLGSESDDDRFPVAVTGLRDGDRLTFEFEIRADGFAGTPFVCSGELSANRRVIEGDWRAPCLHPSSCACGGASGRLVLRRSERS